MANLSTAHWGRSNHTYRHLVRGYQNFTNVCIYIVVCFICVDFYIRVTLSCGKCRLKGAELKYDVGFLTHNFIILYYSIGMTLVCF